VEISDPVPFLLEAGKRKTHLPLLIETTNFGTIPNFLGVEPNLRKSVSRFSYIINLYSIY
jgi:hypothetical protein